MHALFLRNLTINPLILKVFALTKVGETSGARVGMGAITVNVPSIPFTLPFTLHRLEQVPIQTEEILAALAKHA